MLFEKSRRHPSHRPVGPVANLDKRPMRLGPRLLRDRAQIVTKLEVRLGGLFWIWSSEDNTSNYD